MKIQVRPLKSAGLIVVMLVMSVNANAGWSLKTANSAFYTDDVALFSVTRRLSLKDDPTNQLLTDPAKAGILFMGLAQNWNGLAITLSVKLICHWMRVAMFLLTNRPILMVYTNCNCRKHFQRKLKSAYFTI